MAGTTPAHFPALAIALVLFLVHAALFHGFVVDDAFISFRYARSLAEGFGPAFNPGDRVEGFSNPAFTLLLSVLYPLVPHPEHFPWLARAIGVLAGALGLVLLARTPVGTARPGLDLALLLTGTVTCYALWAVGGLETSTYGLLLVAAFLVSLARPRRTPALAGLGALLALVILSRPEGVLPAAAFLAWRLIDPATRGDLRGHAIVASCAMLPVAGWIALRLVWFDSILPNTYYAKRLDLGTAVQWGDWYLRGFVRDNGWGVLYLPAPLAFLSRDGRRPAALAALVLLFDLPFIYVAGGDWMDNHRFVAPMFPFLALLVGLGWFEAVDRLARLASARAGRPVRWPVPAGLALAWVLLLLPTIALTQVQIRRPYVAVSPYYDTLGRLIGHVAPPEWTVAIHDIGAVGWYGGTRVLDLLGLVDRHLARDPADADSLVMARQPELVVLHYDNLKPRPKSRWRPIEWPGFESLYVAPEVGAVPGSLRVRRDVVADVEARLATLPPSLAADLERLDQHLRRHQPDMWPVIEPQP